MVEALIRAKADVRIKNLHDESPVDIACTKKMEISSIGIIHGNVVDL